MPLLINGEAKVTTINISTARYFYDSNRLLVTCEIEST